MEYGFNFSLFPLMVVPGAFFNAVYIINQSGKKWAQLCCVFSSVLDSV